jgi:multidrug efflux pump
MSPQEVKESVFREFKLTTLALKNKNTVFMLIFIIFGFGLYSYIKLPKELFPEIVWPQIMVQTVYPGNSPIDIENLVTRPLEKEIESVRGLKEITSISAQDASMIFAEFNTDVDLEDALRRVKDAVDIGKNELPPDIISLYGGPLVFDIDFSEFPILSINLSGEYSIEELKDYAEYIEDELDVVSEVSKINIEGVNEREVKINVDLMKLMAYDLTFYDLKVAIQSENLTMSGGEILLGKTRRSIRVTGEVKNMKELGNIIVKREEGSIIYLHDVADVIYGYEEPSSFARLDKDPVVSVQVVKKGGENLLSATSKIMKILDQAKEDHMLPEDLEISITNDQSDMVKMQLANLENSIFMSVILVVLVLFFFLGIRNAVFVGIAIPLSMLLSFVIISVIDFRINMIVLFALILALGMLVDNAIVVVENIYRFVDEGFKPWEAARRAVGEIAIPIITSTATTLAAFLPLAMWEGIMGEFMKYLPITLIIVLSSSLFVALVITPVIAATYIKVNGKSKQTKERQKKGLRIAAILIGVGLLFVLLKWMVFGNLLILFGLLGLFYHTLLHKAESWFQDVFLTRLESIYDKTLIFSLRKKNPLWLFLGMIVFLFFTIGFYFASGPKVLLFPENDPNYINIVTELPKGTDITATNEFVMELEEKIISYLAPNSAIVESVLATVGVGNPEDFSSSGKPNEGLITINFVDYEFRGERNTADIKRELSDLLIGNYPGIQFEILKDEGGPPAGKPINIEIIGHDFQQLIHLTDTMQTIIELAEISGIEGLKMNISTDQPELLVNIDRDKAQRYGLSTQVIAGTLRNALFGEEVSKYKIGEDEYPIMIRLKDQYRYNLSTLENMKITYFDEGTPIKIPIASVADFEYTTTYSSVRRKDLDRVITLYSNVIEGYNPTEINQLIRAELANFEMPVGYTYEFTGEQEEQAESMDFLAGAMMIAVSLILLILVSQFNSVIRPLIIIFSVVLSTIGVFGGLATFQMDFIIIMTGIGIISLAGIVVNNAIVLIDYIELLKKRRRNDLGLEADAFLPIKDATECVVQAGKTRLRPVLLTAITTIMGLVPMAVGMNIDFAGLFTAYKPNIYFGGDMAAMWAPMSWTVIFGLTFATFLTLIIVPVMYRLTTIIQKKFAGFKENVQQNGLNSLGIRNGKTE